MPCIEDIASSAVDIQLYKDQINALIDPSEQTSLEFIIQGQSNVKAKNGLLEELCYNYFHTDNENFGCKVRLPKVQIFYESPSAYLDDVLLQHLKQFDQFSPFDEIMELELVPYGRTTVGQDGAYICSGGADFCKVNWLQVSTIFKLNCSQLTHFVSYRHVYLKFNSATQSTNTLLCSSLLALPSLLLVQLIQLKNAF